MTNPTAAGFDGRRGIRLPPYDEDYRFRLLRSKTKLPSETPDRDFKEQLVWLDFDNGPAQLFWCNANDEWFELSFTPIKKP